MLVSQMIVVSREGSVVEGEGEGEGLGVGERWDERRRRPRIVTFGLCACEGGPMGGWPPSVLRRIKCQVPPAPEMRSLSGRSHWLILPTRS